ncbi:hypothetical protein rpr22_0141 [Rickettsia prowazekii str. Rp22]|uniref:Uncharacterized protein n=1 Tax=Rickettsia prowazekii (strain Rp22) TaxID=449216 RepID=D5AW60_RICPP|nr:hypothetical protein rpr22_0141 [Rickettsia prowazekii str. Rp22]AGJ02715.1 DNA-directed RNA polymerase subunit beta [Rickettsia prowazekii str. Breinl]EOB10029.1 hypothetical protein H376_5410 [Rickettsia prowazekii str. GvF12]
MKIKKSLKTKIKSFLEMFAETTQDLSKKLGFFNLSMLKN